MEPTIEGQFSDSDAEGSEPGPKRPRVDVDEEEEEDAPVDRWVQMLRETPVADVAATSYTHYIPSKSDLHTALQEMLGTDSSSLCVFDAKKQAYVGFLAVLDVAIILVQSLKDQRLNPEDFADMASLCLTLKDMDHRHVMDVINVSKRNPFHHVVGTTSLLEAVRVMVRLGVHAIAVDPVLPSDSTAKLGNMLTQKQVVRFVDQHLEGFSSLARVPVSDILARHPALRNVISVRLGDSALDAFELMTHWRITGVPVLSEDDRIVGCLSVNDVKIVCSRPRDLMLLYEPVHKLLAHIRARNEMLVTPVVTAVESDSFGIVVQKVVDSNVHRVFVVDEAKHVSGILTLGNILEELITH